MNRSPFATLRPIAVAASLALVPLLACTSSGDADDVDAEGGRGGQARAGGAAGAADATGGGTPTDEPAGGEGGGPAPGAAGGSAGTMVNGGAAGQTPPDAGMAVDAAPAAPTQPEKMWVNRRLEWKPGAQPDIDEPSRIDNWVKPINYVAGTVHVRIVSETVGQAPAFHELCVVDKRGPDHFVCFRCPNDGIATATETTCAIQPTKCNAEGDGTAVGSCYGGNYRFFERPTRTWHRLRSQVDIASNGAPNLGCQGPLCEAGRASLEASSLPFSARVTVVLVPGGQTFSGWDKYPKP